MFSLSLLVFFFLTVIRFSDRGAGFAPSMFCSSLLCALVAVVQSISVAPPWLLHVAFYAGCGCHVFIHSSIIHVIVLCHNIHGFHAIQTWNLRLRNEHSTRELVEQAAFVWLIDAFVLA